MDGQRFDEIAMTLGGAGQSRRAALRVLGAALLGALGGAAGHGEAAGKGCAARGKSCEKDGQCCSKRCHRGKCAPCPNGTTECHRACVHTDRDIDHCGGCGNRCVAGQSCVAGACQCNGAACAGCCAGTTCRAGQSDQSCGAGGVACAACGADQECVGGTCTCTAASCWFGCCAGTECRLGTGNDSCGANGAACVACAAGQRCRNRACVCDTTSCHGCCAGDECRPGDSDPFCGTGGATCRACPPNQRCAGGVCTCTAAICPTGCCAGTECRNGDADGFCGTGGATCQACASYQTCANGACVDRACGAGGPCRVFLTSTEHDGNLGGLAGADRICQRLAAAANLPGAASFMAWASDASASPATRFPTKSTGPYWRVDGTTIADSWADLTDGGLDAPINVTETGATGVTSRVWTHTAPNGTRATDRTDACDNWTVNFGGGREGQSDLIDGGWTYYRDISCRNQRRLYCFQQG
jgi:hypothetical protein